MFYSPSEVSLHLSFGVHLAQISRDSRILQSCAGGRALSTALTVLDQIGQKSHLIDQRSLFDLQSTITYLWTWTCFMISILSGLCSFLVFQTRLGHSRLHNFFSFLIHSNGQSSQSKSSLSLFGSRMSSVQSSYFLFPFSKDITTFLFCLS